MSQFRHQRPPFQAQTDFIRLSTVLKYLPGTHGSDITPRSLLDCTNCPYLSGVDPSDPLSATAQMNKYGILNALVDSFR